MVGFFFNSPVGIGVQWLPGTHGWHRVGAGASIGWLGGLGSLASTAEDAVQSVEEQCVTVRKSDAKQQRKDYTQKMRHFYGFNVRENEVNGDDAFFLH